MLLPLTNAHVDEMSLVAHLAFSAFRSGDGSQHLLYRLVRTTYLSYLLWDKGIGDATYELYCDAERELEDTACAADQTARWALSEHGTAVIEQILRVFDIQLAGVSRKTFADCHGKLEYLLNVRIPATQRALFASD
ncbi:hypothetical protein [Paraburkholderia phenoliruptrix]|uniref:hypothetical protein n=1 Tax=Paraburkholderia phenoliruptrix TaxID=252970 RepID=UPI002869A2CC|nr:hypothetical protein [Paraburkholderia phenoliruptrix]WMY09573.1 hypothetical protein P3F88_07355 [Paraburkholderia phenoliruptrix]